MVVHEINLISGREGVPGCRKIVGLAPECIPGDLKMTPEYWV